MYIKNIELHKIKQSSNRNDNVQHKIMTYSRRIGDAINRRWVQMKLSHTKNEHQNEQHRSRIQKNKTHNSANYIQLSPVKKSEKRKLSHNQSKKNQLVNHKKLHMFCVSVFWWCLVLFYYTSEPKHCCGVVHSGNGYVSGITDTPEVNKKLSGPTGLWKVASTTNARHRPGWGSGKPMV